MNHKSFLVRTIAVLLVLISFNTIISAQANIGIGIALPDASAKLDITSTSQGILVPRMTTAARTGIAAPAKGLMVYDSTVKAFYYHNGTAWAAMGGVPTGGTANQVLAKVDATNFNTQWVTPSGGGASLQLVATKTTGSQTLSNANGANTGDLITFDNVVTSPTSGSYNTSTNTYTVAVAGLYFVQATTRCVDNSTPTNTLWQYLYVDINNGGLNSVDNVLTLYPTVSNSNFPAGSKGRGYTGVMLYLNANDAITIKGLTANSSTAGTTLKTDGSCRFMVVKM